MRGSKQVSNGCHRGRYGPPSGLYQVGAGGSVVVDLLFMYFHLLVEVLCLTLFWYALLCFLSSFAIILERKRELVSLLLLSF